ncbi:MAG TPA: protein-disulfide reductase DsbD domain-containing protein [Acetobacteraceae bacterium]
MIRLAVLLPLAFLAAMPAWAGESAAVRSSRATVTLVSDTDAVRAGQPLRLGLRMRLAPGWHTYWRNPGDAGVPPELTLTLPAGATAGDLQWPTPVRLAEGPLMTYGYTGEVLLPVAVTPGAGPLHVEASATWLVCEHICVPEEGRFTLDLQPGDLPPGILAPSAQAPLFAAANARMPRPSPFPATVAPDGTLTLRGAGLSAAAVRDAWFFPGSDGAVENAAPQRLVAGDGEVSLVLKRGMPQPGQAAAAAAVAGLAGTVVLRDTGGQETYLDVAAKPGAAPAAALAAAPAAALAAAPAAALAAAPLAQTLLLALLGGLLLNLMPCVFPVLAMKAMALARMSGAALGEVRRHALSYTAGVMVAFGALGGALLALRAAGGAVGWGFQFQSPAFVAAMAWVLFGVGLNLSGVFQVGGRLAGAGQGLASRGGHAGSFATGALAVLVATPCTAPFMGAAIAAALAAPAAVTVLVFGALGLGLAAPYAVLALLPGAARLLPRPGAWMDVLRGVLAFPMYAAAAWLVWVISQQAGPDGVLAALGGLLLVGFAAWSYGLAQASGGRWLGRGAALAAVALAAALLPGLGAAPAAQAEAAATEGVEPYTPARLASLRADGRPVFVNMTAAWCVSCLVNERVALAPAAVRDAFATHRVAYLKGDWTRGDPAITAFLREHGRDGVPLYVFYPAGSGTPTVLPQILTEAAVLEQLDRAGG